MCRLPCMTIVDVLRCDDGRVSIISLSIHVSILRHTSIFQSEHRACATPTPPSSTRPHWQRGRSGVQYYTIARALSIEVGELHKASSCSWGYTLNICGTDPASPSIGTLRLQSSVNWLLMQRITSRSGGSTGVRSRVKRANCAYPYCWQPPATILPSA